MVSGVFAPREPLLTEILEELFLSDSKERTYFNPFANENSGAMSLRRTRKKPPQQSLGEIVGMMSGENRSIAVFA